MQDYSGISHKMSIYSNTQKTMSKGYQPGVDGLRAIAVLIVLCFHAGFSFITGGYVGVDVFFVISGYLITGIIVKAIDKQTFNFISFFLSRISRLYPALIFTAIIIALAGYFIYSPEDFKLISTSGNYALASISNIYFAESVGYFDKSSEINPFLHTWSLAVEQQFYLFWPFILLLLVKISRKFLAVNLFILTIILTLASAWSTVHMPVQGYYWTLFRMFELSAGGVIFFVKDGINLKNTAKEVLLLVGLSLILYSAIYFTPQTIFPGYNALIPVIGAMLCIFCCNAKYTGKFMSSRLLTGIGIISYSVYLIHWPLMVFYKYYIYRELLFIEKTSLVIGSIFIAYFMYTFIENRYRKINLTSLNQKSVGFVLVFIAVLSFSALTVFNNGFPGRSKVNHTDEDYTNSITYGGENVAQGPEVLLGDKKGKIAFVIMGDSFARQYANAIDSNLKARNRSAIGFFADGCLYSYVYATKINNLVNNKCGQMLVAATKYARDNNLPIMFAQEWTAYLWTTSDEKRNLIKFENYSAYTSFMMKNINNIFIKSRVNKIILVGDLPQSPGTGGAASCLSRPSVSRKKCIENLITHVSASPAFGLNQAIGQLVNDSQGMSFINPFEFVCKNNLCSAFNENGLSLYSDNVHLSKYGASIVTPMILDSLKEKGIHL